MARRIYLDDRKRNPQADFIIKLNFDMIGAVFLELDTAKKVDIGGMGIEIGETEGNLRLGNGLILFRVIDEAFLDKITASPAPARPEAEFEKTNGKRGGWDGPNHSDERLLAAEFRSDILTENGSLNIGKNGVGAHERGLS